MKTLKVFFIFALCAFSQTVTPAPATATTVPVQQMFALGASYSPGGSPAAAGTAMYACLPAACSFGISSKPTTSTGTTYAFLVADALPASIKPFVVTTDLAGGVAQHIVKTGPIDWYVPLAAGFSYTGAANTGWNWSTGVLAAVQVKGSFFIMPNVRAIKSSVNGNSGYQLIFGALFGWGK